MPRAQVDDLDIMPAHKNENSSFEFSATVILKDFLRAVIY